MFERKLKALGYLEWDKVNGNNDQHFRKVIVWLEDQKIRHYTIDDRAPLRDITSPEWPKVFEKYCNDVKCPITKNAADQLEWFIGYAIWLEFGDDCQKYQGVLGSKAKVIDNQANVPNVKSINPLDNLDFDSNAFKVGVGTIAKLLRVPQHSDHLVTLQACSKLVCNKLNAEAVKQPNIVNIKGKSLTAMTIGPGFNMGDKMLDNAARGLSLLYIQDLRNLQTKINETIVAVQNITANPKTDTKLGKVGK
ncbi:RNA transcription, translation and transport factor protein [Harpegnathos saltator]|uniref:UPF0568 protein C14orf166-like protein n=1 Tax=Harpegnathos saltator TaxID=610380 RepID=E2BQ22_HARSA|nr:RNA transcription, translation and transport factor protein [Harpegnathos saltator]EFN82210.1 UPF0568 protein C14orf166-like protein [Harpegnathos saltator]